MPASTEAKEESHSKTSLFVRNIPFDAKVEQVEAFFSEIGPIRSCFLMHKENSKTEHKGMGIVQFALATDAEKAMADLKKTKFQGRILKMEYAIKKSIVREKTTRPVEKPQKPEASSDDFTIKKGRLIVRNLSFHCKEDHLKEVFAKFGTIKECSLPTKQDKKTPRGFAFLQFEKYQDAQKAMEKLNGTEILGRTIAVDWSIPKDKYDSLAAQTAQEDSREVEEAESVEEDINDEDEDEEQESAEGEDDEEEESGEEEEDVADELPKTEKGPRRVSLGVKVEKGSTLFLRNLSFDTTQETLEERFSTFGKVLYARITIDKESGRPKGTAFVAFVQKEDADKCIEEYERAREMTQMEGVAAEKTQSSSILVPELPSSEDSPFVLDGRFIHVFRAVDRDEAHKLTNEHRSERRERDKRNLYLMKEGVIFPDSNEAKGMASGDLSKRMESYTQRKKLLEKNPNLFISKTRLSVRNIKVDEKQLRQAAIQSVKDYWKEVEEGSRKLCLDEWTMEEEEKSGRKRPSSTRKILLKQVKIVRSKDKIDPVTKKPKSKGYGFIEFVSHADALVCLRSLNNNTRYFPDTKFGPIVEFSVENNLILKKRNMNLIKQKSQQKAEDKAAPRDKKDKNQKDGKEKKQNIEKKQNTEKKKEEKNKQETPKKGPKRVGNATEKPGPQRETPKRKRQDPAVTEPKAKKQKKEKAVKPPISKAKQRELQEEATFENLVRKYKKDFSSSQSEMSKWI